jgi:hypothetical protein
MSVPVIKIVERTIIDFPSAKGQLFQSERDAQNYKAEVKVLALFSDAYNQAHYSDLYHIIRYADDSDVALLIAAFEDYRDNILPAFEALEGRFSYTSGRVIELEDGRTFEDRKVAALHVLVEGLKKAFTEGKFSQDFRAGFCGVSTYLSPDHVNFRREVTAWKFGYNFAKLCGDRGDFAPINDRDLPLKLLRALKIIADERSRPIAGVPRQKEAA